MKSLSIIAAFFGLVFAGLAFADWTAQFADVLGPLLIGLGLAAAVRFSMK